MTSFRGWSRWHWAAVSALLAAVVVLITVAVPTLSRLEARRINRSNVEAAENAACGYATTLLRYGIWSADRFDSYSAAISQGATGSWLAAWDKQKQSLRDTMLTTRASSQVWGAWCTVDSHTADTAHVSTNVPHTLASDTAHEPRHGELQYVLDLRKVNGRWLCEGLTPPMIDTFASAAPS
ncbi:hypothetical protein ACFXHA_41200 [Nocardia sp. NPDC059240]|uniref:hypothetical protein n=1 Tax=Nocardia sp. NPDC059240 TaxID=3346786 RepID=UPI0036BE0C30